MASISCTSTAADILQNPEIPDFDCKFCPRLSAFRDENKENYPDFFNAPVPSFGPIDSDLLIIGLAPGLKGANATGRPFTNDYAGDLLYATLEKFGFSKGDYDKRADDGLDLINARIANAVRCLPPKNKPVAAEVNNCQEFLLSEIMSLRQNGGAKIIMALGGLAHNAVLGVLKQKKSAYKFGHNKLHELNFEGEEILLIDSYHCSRYNTNTRLLTTDMFEDVFEKITHNLKLNKKAK